VVAAVDEALAELASRVDPALLGKACHRVRQYADPDGPKPDPKVDYDRRGITVSAFDGMLLVRGQLDPEGGAALQAALDALMPPPKGGADRRTAAQRRADALVELARGALRGDRLPDVGGARPQIGILLTPDNLVGDTAARPPAGDQPPADDPLAAAGIPRARPAAWLDWIGDVSDQTAQRVACDADVWRVVLDPTTSRPLELGRTHRLVPSWLRKALYARDRGCVFPGCGAPAAWTDAHHFKPWARGGRTDAVNLGLLCRHHHVLVHEGGWSISRDPRTGRVVAFRPDGTEFVPPGRRPPPNAGRSTAAGP
jgi:hypothetical protein